MLAWQSLDLREDPDEPHYVGDPGDLIDAAAFVAELVDRPLWMRDALCKEHPEVQFFVGHGGDVRPAKAVCDACLVRDECLAYVLPDRYTAGIWGGTSERQRKSLRRGSTDVDEAA